LQSLPVTFDPVKSEANMLDAARGFGFELAGRFDFHTALVEVDERRDYGETRFSAIGTIDVRLHVLIFTIRENELRVISLRKANGREVSRYEKFADERAG
jgi:uncharacterized protein